MTVVTNFSETALNENIQPNTTRCYTKTFERRLNRRESHLRSQSLLSYFFFFLVPSKL